MSSLVSGLLTIGPRFGGAIDDAARRFQAAVDDGRAPEEYVEWMKRQGERVPGIGHRIKSKDNRDARVALLQAYARKFFPATKYLDYAVQVRFFLWETRERWVFFSSGLFLGPFCFFSAGVGARESAFEGKKTLKNDSTKLFENDRSRSTRLPRRPTWSSTSTAASARSSWTCCGRAGCSPR